MNLKKNMSLLGIALVCSGTLATAGNVFAATSDTEQEMTVNDSNLSKSNNVKSTNHADNLSSEGEKSFWGYVAMASNLLIGSLLLITKKYRDKK